MRIERSEETSDPGGGLVADSPVLRYACLPTKRPLPGADDAPATAGAEEALRAAAAMESIVSLSEWRVAGAEALEEARRATQAAREQALVQARAGGQPDGGGPGVRRTRWTPGRPGGARTAPRSALAQAGRGLS